MPSPSPVRACLLLAAFLVGAVAGPSVHRVHHAEERAVRQAQLHGSAGHVHAEHAAFSVGVPAWMDGEVTCVLCTSWTGAELALGEGVVSERLPGDGYAGDLSIGASAGSGAHFIRGPPGWV